MSRRVRFKKSVVDSLLTYSKSAHPMEGILLLRGKTAKEEILVNEVMIPPFAVHGEGFSSFPLYSLPLDTSIMGVAHSHPSGALKPSSEDIYHGYGRLMVIVGYPYESEEDIGVFDKDGNRSVFEVV